MTAPATSLPIEQHRGSGVLTVGFGAAIAMWAVGYVSRLPALLLPSPIVLALLLACMLGAGWVLGRCANLGWRYGAGAGLVTGAINLLILGSLLTGGEGTPSAFVWLPGSILLAAAAGAAGAAIGRLAFRGEAPFRDWSAALVKVAVAAALLLLGVGGLVTSTEAGLAVVDWPNSFGYNMFLYPLSRMTGGVYFEHSHRLFGALVGLTTLAVALQLQLREPRRWVRALGWVGFVLVVIQGLLGGLRVTGSFTTSTLPEAMRPNIALALVHGVLGQVFFGLLVALGAFTSAAWRGARPIRRDSVGVDRVLGCLLVLLLVVQLVLGATQRHLAALLMVHIGLGVAVVAPLALHVGFRAWGLNEGQRLLQRLGIALIVGVGLQILLGLAAFVATRGAQEGAEPPAAEVLLTTTHQWFGAILLALSVSVLCWSFRLLEGSPRRPPSSVPPGPPDSRGLA